MVPIYSSLWGHRSDLLTIGLLFCPIPVLVWHLRVANVSNNKYTIQESIPSSGYGLIQGPNTLALFCWIGLTWRQTFLSWLQQRWVPFGPGANPPRCPSSRKENITYVNLCTHIPGLVLIRLTLVTCRFLSHAVGREWNYAEFLCLSHWFHLESHWLSGGRWITKWKSWSMSRRKWLQGGNPNSDDNNK